MEDARRRSVPIIGFAILLAAGCTNDVVAPSAVSRPSVRGTVTQSGSLAGHSISNSVKYKDAGVKPAVGRSGSASLEVRALLARAGSTQVEASTGSLEGGTSPGQIEKVQLKMFIGDMPTSNYNKLTGGGYWTESYTSLARGNEIQVQANVTGIDPKRTDVVTVKAAVALRPDITVSSVAGPRESPPNAPVTFTATVSEINGDVGARSDCVLSIDGGEVDRADGIWVDAGGTVTCQFTYVFGTPGTYAVAVTASNVVPSDWDLANNTASASITVLEPGQPIQSGYMRAYQFVGTYTARYWNTAGLYPYDQTWDYTWDYSWAYLSGYESGVNPPGAGNLQRVDATMSVDGSIVSTASLTPTWQYQYQSGDYFQECGQYYQVTVDGTTYRYSPDIAYWCNYGSLSSPADRWSYYVYQRIEGEVTYYSRGFYCSIYGCNTYTYSQAYSYGPGTSLGWAVGNTVRLQVSFVDADGVAHTADKSVALTLRPYNYTNNGCWFDSYRGSNGCYTAELSATELQGWLSW